MVIFSTLDGAGTTSAAIAGYCLTSMKDIVRRKTNVVELLARSHNHFLPFPRAHLHDLGPVLVHLQHQYIIYVWKQRATRLICKHLPNRISITRSPCAAIVQQHLQRLPDISFSLGARVFRADLQPISFNSAMNTFSSSSVRIGIESPQPTRSIFTQHTQLLCCVSPQWKTTHEYTFTWISYRRIEGDSVEEYVEDKNWISRWCACPCLLINELKWQTHTENKKKKTSIKIRLYCLLH